MAERAGNDNHARSAYSVTSTSAMICMIHDFQSLKLPAHANKNVCDEILTASVILILTRSTAVLAKEDNTMASINNFMATAFIHYRRNKDGDKQMYIVLKNGHEIEAPVGVRDMQDFAEYEAEYAAKWSQFNPTKNMRNFIRATEKS